MYQIYKGIFGEFICLGKVQDGTERWTEKTLEAAVKSLKQFAKVMNHTKIRRKDIDYYEHKQVTEIQWERKPLPK